MIEVLDSCDLLYQSIGTDLESLLLTSCRFVLFHWNERNQI
jgi:hypothetical protein